jgi:hypothetical protein
MKNSLLLIGCGFLLGMGACKNEDRKVSPKSENDIDAARNFIRSALDGKFDDARNYLLADSANINYMDVAERNYQKADQTVKDGYKGSSIRIYSPVTNVNDSTTIVIFSNSFKNDPDTLRILKVKDQWLVDLKYLYQHDADTIFKKIVSKDSLR